MVLLVVLVILPGCGDAPPEAPAGATSKPGDDASESVAAALRPFRETIPVSLVEFEMVPVPGSDDIPPFYIGRHEVTWDAFGFWAFLEDVDHDESLSGPRREMKKIDLRQQELRPSAPYDDIYRGYGRQDRPALGMSCLAARLYCRWLSEQTGRRYRLPTKAEWLHAYRLGHGDPEQVPPRAQLDAIAWHDGNSDWETHAPGTRQPSAIGVHDMLGNVAEWTLVDGAAGDPTDAGACAGVIGGHFLTDPADLRGALLIAEEASWNASYPNEPVSKWWYVDAEFTGFRLVCEP
jgi:sulfatase modifying factor 1